jgi:N utilization substance protein B
MQARRISRELALLSLSQLPAKPSKLEAQQLQDVVLAAIRALTSEAQDALEAAAAELQQSNNRLLNSEIRATDVESARVMLSEAIGLTQTAINRLGGAVEVPEFISLANQEDVRSYTMELVRTLRKYQTTIDELLSSALVDWQLTRLAAIDRDILRIAVAEMRYLNVPDRIAINEAVEIAKRYSGEDGHRFINGVLRRVVDAAKTTSAAKVPDSTAAQTLPN